MKRRIAHAMRRVARTLIAKSNNLSPVDIMFAEAGQRAAQDYVADLAAYARHRSGAKYSITVGKSVNRDSIADDLNRQNLKWTSHR